MVIRYNGVYAGGGEHVIYILGGWNDSFIPQKYSQIDVIKKCFKMATLLWHVLLKQYIYNMYSKCVCLFSVGARMVFTCFYQPFETLMILMEVMICTARLPQVLIQARNFTSWGRKKG